MCFINTSESQYVNNRHANKQVNSENWSLTKVLPMFFERKNASLNHYLLKDLSGNSNGSSVALIWKLFFGIFIFKSNERNNWDVKAIPSVWVALLWVTQIFRQVKESVTDPIDSTVRNLFHTSGDYRVLLNLSDIVCSPLFCLSQHAVERALMWTDLRVWLHRRSLPNSSALQLTWTGR